MNITVAPSFTFGQGTPDKSCNPCLSCPAFMLFIEQQRLLQAHGGSKELGPHQQASVTRSQASTSQASTPKELARKTHLQDH